MTKKIYIRTFADVNTLQSKLTLILFLLIANSAFSQIAVRNISPASATVGSTITITGSDFNPDVNGNLVRFGTTQATVTSATSTSITAIVPSGASFAPITVLNTFTHLSARSSNAFTPTFTPNKGSITISDFDNVRYYLTASGPTALTITDIDGDGQPDLAVATTINNVVSVLRNTSTPGSLSFEQKKDFLVGTTPYAIAAGDIDGDGKPDLIVPNSNSDNITVLRNTSTIGNINFARSILPAGDAPQAIALSDFDNDGKLDIVVANYYDSNVSVYKNNSTPGNLNFSPRINFSVEFIPSSISTGDLDGDGKDEIITTNTALDANLSILRNTSTSTGISFAPKILIRTGSDPQDLIAADINGDGKYDLATCHRGSVSVLLNTSTAAGNITMAAFKSFNRGIESKAIAAGDIDGDGKLDLVTANLLALAVDRVSILRNTSVVNNVDFAPKVALVSGRGAYAAAVNDLDKDGKPEVIIVNNNDQSVCIFRNKSDVSNPVQASNLIIGSTTTTATNIKWTNGNGDARVVFIKATTATETPGPVNAITYQSEPNFSPGTQIGTSGWYAVYNGTGNNVDVTGLRPDTYYRVMVCEYTGISGTEQYLSISETGNPATFKTVSDDANLNSLTIAPGPLNLPFDPATLTYSATVANNTSSITINPTTANAGATIKINNNTVTSGSPSNIPLSIGLSTINIVVTAADGTTTKSYVLMVTRAASSTATLINLTPDYGTLTPDFASSILNYTMNVPYAITNIKLTPVSSEARANIKINNATVVSGTISASLPLNTGNNTISILVTAPDGISTKLYTLNILRAAQPNAHLSSLVVNGADLNPVFDPDVLNYTINVAQNVADIKLKPTAVENGAAITLNGAPVNNGAETSGLALIPGNNVLNITVTAGDGITKLTYRLDITRAKMDQYISFGTIEAKTSCDPDFYPNASSSNPILPISYTSSNSSTAIVTADGKIHITGAGTTIITANQAGNSDFNAAQPKTQTLTVNRPVAPIVTIGSNVTSFCVGEPAILTAVVHNLGSGLTYQWLMNGSSINGANAATITIYPIDANVIYKCVVTNTNSCNATGISNDILLNIHIPTTPSLNIVASTTDPICAGSFISFRANALQAGSSPIFDWQINGLSTGASNIEFKTNQLKDGDVVRCILTDPDISCRTPEPVISNSIVVNVLNPSIPHLSIQVSKNPVKAGEQVIFTASSDAKAPLSYEWRLNQKILNGITASTFTTNVLTDGDVVSCRAIENFPCGGVSMSHSITMSILKELTVGIPSAFSPNGDGVNDHWRITTSTQNATISVRIFGRSGLIVYENKKYDSDWDGTSKGQLLAPGIYYYIVKINESKTLSGSLTIIR